MGELLRIQKYIMLLTNRWEVHSRSALFNNICKIYAVFIESYYNIFTQSLLVNAITRWKCTYIFYELNCYYIHHTNNIIMNQLLKKDAIKKALKYIIYYEKTGYAGEEQSSKDIYDYYSQLNVKIGKYVMVMGTLVACWTWYLLSILHTITGGSETCPLTTGILYQVWYPFNTRCNWLPILCDLIMCYIAILMHILNRVCSIALVIFVLAQIKILNNEIRGIDAKAKEMRRIYGVCDEIALDVVVNGCIKRHQNIISLMGLLQRATKEMMLIGFFSNSIEIAGFMIQMFTADSRYHLVRSFLLFPTDILQILVFYWFANEVYTESTTLADNIYNLNWVNYPTPLRKKLILMMMRSQRPLYFRGTGIGEMTLEKYKRVLKSCFSVVTFFQTMYEA